MVQPLNETPECLSKKLIFLTNLIRINCFSVTGELPLRIAGRWYAGKIESKFNHFPSIPNLFICTKNHFLLFALKKEKNQITRKSCFRFALCNSENLPVLRCALLKGLGLFLEPDLIMLLFFRSLIIS